MRVEGAWPWPVTERIWQEEAFSSRRRHGEFVVCDSPGSRDVLYLYRDQEYLTAVTVGCVAVQVDERVYVDSERPWAGQHENAARSFDQDVGVPTCSAPLAVSRV